LISLEKQTTEPLAEFITSAKAKMLEYHEQVEQEHKQAQEKIIQESMSLKSHFKEMDALANMVDDLYVSSVDMPKTKNIRTVYKAEVDGDVDWLKIINVLFATNHLRQEDLLRHLPKAMEMVGLKHIAGINVVAIKTQTV
jgi:3-methyladenine DNA glycosylase AlkD